MGWIVNPCTCILSEALKRNKSVKNILSEALERKRSWGGKAGVQGPPESWGDIPNHDKCLVLLVNALDSIWYVQFHHIVHVLCVNTALEDRGVICSFFTQPLPFIHFADGNTFSNFFAINYIYNMLFYDDLVFWSWHWWHVMIQHSEAKQNAGKKESRQREEKATYILSNTITCRENTSFPDRSILKTEMLFALVGSNKKKLCYVILSIQTSWLMALPLHVGAS